MRLDRFTIKAQEALNDAQQAAEAAEQQEVSVEHLLIVLLRQEGGITAPILDRIGANAGLISKQAGEIIAKRPRVHGAVGEAYISPKLKAVLEAAVKEAREMKDDFVSVEHMLIAIASEKGGEAARVLASNGVTRDTVLKALASIRGSSRVTDQAPEEKYQAVAKYTRDLVELARSRLAAQ